MKLLAVRLIRYCLAMPAPATEEVAQLHSSRARASASSIVAHTFSAPISSSSAERLSVASGLRLKLAQEHERPFLAAPVHDFGERV